MLDLKLLNILNIYLLYKNTSFVRPGVLSIFVTSSFHWQNRCLIFDSTNTVVMFTDSSLRLNNDIYIPYMVQECKIHISFPGTIFPNSNICKDWFTYLINTNSVLIVQLTLLGTGDITVSKMGKHDSWYKKNLSREQADLFTHLII